MKQITDKQIKQLKAVESHLRMAVGFNCLSVICFMLEAVIEDLSNTKDKTILNELNALPIIATHAHTRPFVRKWMNVVTGVILPLGVFFYLRMWRFRLRLLRDLRNIVTASENIIRRVEEGKKVTISID